MDPESPSEFVRNNHLCLGFILHRNRGKYRFKSGIPGFLHGVRRSKISKSYLYIDIDTDIHIHLSDPNH